MSSMRVGILHSLSGTMAISEAPLIDAALMAIAEINKTGGILGQSVEPIIEDGASDPVEFERKARKLIQRDRISTVFGCWTSASRKAVKPLFEESNALLWYPVQYEGLECSPNIFYTGSCPNQQVAPAVTWLLQNQGSRFYLLGSDDVFPRTAHKIITAQLKQQGGTVVGQEYFPLGATEFTKTITRIQQAIPDVVFNTLNGDSNLAFYHQYQNSGPKAADIPILAVGVAEAELQRIGAVAVGHYACGSYFQSLDSQSNRTFVRNFQANYGAQRVTSESIEAAYTQVYLWKQAVEQGQSFEVAQVRVAAYGQSFQSPGGLVQIEPNHHVSKACRIGRILPTGQFELVGGSDNLIKPLPWLGVEQVNFREKDLVIDLLAEVSQGIQRSQQLEQKSGELEATMAKCQREIVKRQRVEAVLCDAEAQLQALFAAMNDVVLVIDAQGRYLRIAPTNPALLYKPADELIGKTLHEVFAPNPLVAASLVQADTFLEYIQQALSTQETVNVEYSRPTLGKEEVWLAASISPLSENSVIWVERDITEYKLAQEALRQSEERMRALLNAIPDRMFRHRVDGTYLDIKDKSGDSIVPPETLIGKNLRDAAMPEAIKERLLALFQIAVETGELQTYEYELPSLKGIQTYEARIVKSGADEAVRIVRNITERQQAEVALRISEERYRSVIAAMAEGIVLQQADGLITTWNEAAEKILGLSAQQMMRRTSVDPFWRTIYEDGSPFPGELHPSMVTLHTGQPQSNVIMGVQKLDGTLTWISINSQPLFRESETQPYAVVTSFADITERKQAEEALRQAEERYRSIFENTDKGLFQATPDGRYLSANPALALIYGYSSPEDLIANLTDINQQLYVDPQRRAEFLALLQAQDMVANFESQVYRQDGRIIWISENAHVVRDEKGQPLYYEGSIMDITVRKVWEEALRYQQECAEQLLLNILPDPIAQRLKLWESTIADSFAEATVLFADLVNFTEISAQIPPPQLVDLLNQIFSEFDRLTEKHGLEKIKTIGDAYMVVGGLPMPKADHAEAIAEMALDMQQIIPRFQRDDGKPFNLRIGIHTGPVVAGVIGTKKFSYDLWGDTVNVASRMESHGIAGKIQVTATTYELLKDKYLFEKRGATLIKGKGEMITYWLTGRKANC